MAKDKKQGWVSDNYETEAQRSSALSAHRSEGCDHGLVAKRARRRERAEDRALNRELLTPEQQLAELDRRLGKGVGAAKERTRLAQA